MLVFFHREPWSTDSVKQPDGGYQYTKDEDLEKFRSMVEDYEMYQAIHRIRPSLQPKKIYVFGLIPKEIYDEFQVEDVTFKKNSEVTYLVGWKSSDEFMEQQIGDEGIYMAELAKVVAEEEKITKQSAYERIHKFARQHSDEYEIGDRKIGKMVVKYVQRRR